ncbi:MAG: glycosyltransferase family 4 protein [Candidatus Schekmanbacteria bacterium]|nr:glycosyltransferase family 4 protein [Candidatus Schekmanbacteria bacterium]
MNKKLNILQVLSHRNLERGGAVQAFLLAKGLKERGHQVKCIFNMEDGTVTEKDMGSIKKLKDYSIEFEFFGMNSFREALRMRRILKLNDYDVIHTHRDIALRFILRAASGMKLKSLFTNRGNNYILKNEKKLFFSKKLDRVMAVAEAVKDVLVKKSGMPAEKIEVVYGSFDPEMFTPEIDGKEVRREFNIRDDVPVIGNIAAPQGKKGHPLFFEAAKKVIAARSDVLFMMVGSRLEEKFLPIAKEMGIEKNLLFTGFRNDIARVIAAMDISVCSATKGEGLTGAIRESLAMARPVVSTDVAGNREIVIHKKTGMLVPVKNPDALADAILYLLNHMDEGKQMGLEGRKIVLQKCTNKIRCEKVEKIYHEVLERKSTR